MRDGRSGRGGLRRIAAVLALALVATLASVAYQRVGPLQDSSGYACGDDDPPAPCRIPVKGGGWPVAWLVDRTGISVEGKLFPGEDELRWGAFLVDLAFYAAVAAAIAALRARRRADIDPNSHEH